MMWNWNGASWWWWFLMSGGMLLFWGFVAWVAVQAIRTGNGANTGDDPRGALRTRRARRRGVPGAPRRAARQARTPGGVNG